MAKIFLDTNYVIDILFNRNNVDVDQFENNQLFASPLSIHIGCYIHKKKMPDEHVQQTLAYVKFVPFTEQITQVALIGPTSDFEDNVQLHSAANADCELFLTRDQKLLKMTFFGSMKIIENFE